VEDEPTGFAERVLDVVERIPPGRVMAYGDIAEYLGEGGPRQVGHVMALWGGGVPWWRVTRADGSLSPSHVDRARPHRRARRHTPGQVERRLASQARVAR
jgi:alkylated DNA nucleotide flippase Atl1